MSKSENIKSINKFLYPRIEVKSWKDFLQHLEPFMDGRSIFRGVPNVKYDLVPSVGRIAKEGGYSLALERSLLDRFKREAMPYLGYPPADDWDWLAIAQHHGAPTRLIDWSESPMISMYFAVWGNDPVRSEAVDGGLYIVPIPKDTGENTRRQDPFQTKSVSFIYPVHVTRRIAAQRGLFTIHPDPTIAYDADDKHQIIVPAQLKREFRSKLDVMGFNHATMFPDIDGLAKHLAWRFVPTIAASPPPPVPSSDISEVVSSEEHSPAIGRYHPDDPQKDQWGGKSERNGWRLTAVVTTVGPGWFKTVLTVSSIDGKKKIKEATDFYLHDSFPKQKRSVASKSSADVNLTLYSYGAFTVGVHINDDGTNLELDLSQLKEAPKLFRSR